MPAKPIYCCLGMYGSGSTWLYNVMLGIAAATVAPGTRFAAGLIHFPNQIDLEQIDRDPFFVMKCHHLGQDVMDVIRSRLRSLMISIRDPRDAVVSLGRHPGHDFESAFGSVLHSAQECARRMHEPKTTVFRYEDGFTADPASVAKIAEGMGLHLSPDECWRIFQKNSRQNVEALILFLKESGRMQMDQGDADLHNPLTQWRLGHIGRSGKVGMWKEQLTPSQIEVINRELGGWMEQHGYL
jgi:hypothetical protein